METRHGIGTFVLPPEDSDNFRIDATGFATAANVIELLELRIALETEAARLAAHRRTAVNLDAMKAALLASNDLINHDSDAIPPRLLLSRGSRARFWQPAFHGPDDLCQNHGHSAHERKHGTKHARGSKKPFAAGARRA